MEPEGVVDVLRKLLRGVAPGGVVVDLAAVPPDGVVLHEGEVVGLLDESAFFSRAEVTAEALDLLVDDGLLVKEHDERFPVLISFENGIELVEDVKERTYGRIPDALASRVAAIEGPVQIREQSRVRSFRKTYSK